MSIPGKIEQLKTQLAQVTDQNEEAELIIGFLQKYAAVDSAGSKPYIERLLQLAEKAGSPRYRAWGLNYLAVVTRQAWQNDASLDSARQSLQLFEQLNDRKGMANAFHNIGLTFWNQGNSPEALKNYLQGIQYSEKINDKLLLSADYVNIGNVYQRQSDYAEALKYYSKALALKEETGDRRGAAICYNNIGIAYNELGNYPEAMKNHMQSLHIKVESGDKSGIATAYSNIGNLYEVQGIYQQALENYLQGLKFSREVDAKKTVVYVLNNIGNIHELQGNYPEAMNHYMQALEVGRETGNKNQIAASFINFGKIYTHQGNYPEALKNNFEALAIREEMGDKRGIAVCYKNIGTVYEKQGNHSEAIKYKLLALQIAEAIGQKEIMKECLRSLFNTYRVLGDFENALKYYEEYHRVESELLGEQAQKQLTNLNFQHNMEQKEKDAEIERLKNVELKEALEKLKLEKSRSEQLFQNQLQELKSNALQAQMNPHFVFNSLNAIQQYIWEKDPEEATAYLTRFSKLIRSVLDNSRRQFVTLEQDLTALEYYIELESLRFENKFAHQIVCDSSLDKAAVQLPPMIIQPFVENAIIHGLQPLKSVGKLTIALERKENDILHITIEDNGVGRVKANQANNGKVRSHQSVAIQLTKERLEKMNGGKLNRDAIIISDLYDENRNPTGTKVEINVPVEYP